MWENKDQKKLRIWTLGREPGKSLATVMSNITYDNKQEPNRVFKNLDIDRLSENCRKFGQLYII